MRDVIDVAALEMPVFADVEGQEREDEDDGGHLDDLEDHDVPDETLDVVLWIPEQEDPHEPPHDAREADGGHLRGIRAEREREVGDDDENRERDRVTDGGDPGLYRAREAVEEEQVA